MLVKLGSIADLLRSPDDSSRLEMEFNDQGTLEKCRSAQREFQVVRGVPILLPQNSQFSTSDNYEPLVLRKKNAVLQRLSLVINGSNPVAKRNAVGLIDRLKKSSSKPTILVVGAGLIGEGSQSFYEDEEISLIAFDIFQTEHTSFVADGHSIPIADRCIDAVWIQAVLEHVVDPSRIVSEIHRVLKEKGLIYAETPFIQQVHEGRYDFHRFTESGHRWLFKDFGLIQSGVVWGPGRSLQWSIRYFFWSLTRSKNLAILLTLPFIFLRWFDLITPEKHMVDGACNLFFMGEKSDTSITVQELLNFYKGAQS
jgi:SAM-dependent methyltransferase/uncharacterized protein YbaR (Trm112 family)